MQTVEDPDTATRPSRSGLLAWAAAGAALGLLLVVFQPLLGIGLAVGLPLAALGRARFGAGRVPAGTLRLGAVGVGVLVVTAGLLAPVQLTADDDQGGGSWHAPAAEP